MKKTIKKSKCSKKILSYLTGKEVKFILPKRLQVTGKNGEVLKGGSGHGVQAEQETGQPYYRRKVSYSRKQSMSFEAHGIVKTADGREIKFDMKLKRSEAFKFNEEISLDKNGKVVDPLVINYEGNLTHLTKEKYSFDLDFDGAKDQISFFCKRAVVIWLLMRIKME